VQAEFRIHVLPGDGLSNLNLYSINGFDYSNLLSSIDIVEGTNP